ncbi:MAG: DUF3307 domain-containing protein [Anaerolineales bacterium]|jgi:hypothetical protein
MAIFWRLLLAHLLADFPLQPNSLVRLKDRPAGLAIHLGIHAGVMVAVLWPAASTLWPGLLGLVIFHGLLDRAKIRSAVRLGLSEPGAYLLDQAVHLGSLALLAWISFRFSTAAAALPLATWSIQGVVFILCTHFWAITERILTTGTPTYQAEVRAQMWPRMAVRGLPVLVTIAAHPAALLAGAVVGFPYAGTHYWRRALLTDTAVSALGVGALLLLT